jgi:ATP-dependent RNA helicase DDX27
MLPILERVIHMPRTPAASRALVLTPTRELAAQCLSMTVSIARYTSIKSCLIVGGSKNNAAQATELKTRPDLIIATPGRLLDHVQNAASFDLDDIVILVLDEADRLLDLGFIEEVTEIVKACPVQRQTLLFSATFSTKVDDLVNLSMKRPLRVRAGRQDNTKDEVEVAPRLEQEFVRIRQGNEGNREAILLSLLTRTFKKRVICFFDTKVVAHKMMIIAGLCGIKCGELHGNLTQTQRLEALEAFKNREIDVLLCTDLAARGLDISSVETVINYEMPTQITTYVHRVGRTARAGCGGRSCTMISEGRRHLMKEVIKDAEKKNMKKGPKGSNSEGAVIRSRTVPISAISYFNKKIISLQPHIEEIKAAEEVAKIDRLAEMEATRAKNIMIHADEIKARPKKEWFQSKVRTGRKRKHTVAIQTLRLSNNSQTKLTLHFPAD